MTPEFKKAQKTTKRRNAQKPDQLSGFCIKRHGGGKGRHQSVQGSRVRSHPGFMKGQRHVKWDKAPATGVKILSQRSSCEC